MNEYTDLEKRPSSIVFSEKQITDIEKLAGMGWLVIKMAHYFNIPSDSLQREYENESSLFRYHYDRGRLMIQAEIDVRLSESAKSGNLTAIQMVNKRTGEQSYQNLAYELFGIK